MSGLRQDDHASAVLMPVEREKRQFVDTRPLRRLQSIASPNDAVCWRSYARGLWHCDCCEQCPAVGDEAHSWHPRRFARRAADQIHAIAITAMLIATPSCALAKT